MALRKTLTIAGSDTSGGAGIAADLKTFQEHETYGMTALTTIVTMDPETWSHGVNPIPDRKSTRLNSSHVAISYAVFRMKTTHDRRNIRRRRRLDRACDNRHAG